MWGSVKALARGKEYLMGVRFSVQKPRELVADAEALLDLTRTLVGAVKSMLNEAVTPAQFVGCLFKYYGQGH
ncbi:hypothetical protein RIF29_39429 [Crotalaria pallida]|uniref:Uncharacterized protein n=1 Tax=Crotalaria pallida TaxID=3830 RepID=A0AAN9HMH0_CROPI